MKVFERILYNELLSRTEAKIYHRQGGFLMNKSFYTNVPTSRNSIAVSPYKKLEWKLHILTS